MSVNSLQTLGDYWRCKDEIFALPSWSLATSVTNLGSVEQTLSLLSMCFTLRYRPYTAHDHIDLSACKCLVLGGITWLAVVKNEDVHSHWQRRGDHTNNSMLCLLINKLLLAGNSEEWSHEEGDFQQGSQVLKRGVCLDGWVDGGRCISSVRPASVRRGVSLGVSKS